tara:strand:- start:284 stop:1702 length:1419 start_codon:yes stop_codon:yes gene_type:complete
MPQSYSTGAGGGQDRQAGGTGTGGGSGYSNGGNQNNNNNNNNNVPVTDLSTQADPAQLAQQSALSRAVAAIRGQDFTPQLPNTAGGWMSMATNPFSPFTKSFMDQTRYGMSPASQSIYDGLDPTQRSNIGTPQDQVNYARNQVMQDQAAPNSYTGPQKPSNFSDQQWNSMTQGQQQFMSPEGAFGGQAGMSGQGGQGQAGGMMSQTNMGGSRDYSGAEGTFKPVTFRSGSMGQGDPYAGLSDMAQQGQGLFGQAAAQAQQAPDQFNYNFNPEQAGLDLFNQRSELLQPQFAQQNAQAQESMFGTGRLGLRLAGEGIGAGVDSGMMSPDAFGVNAAQSQALAGLAAQSTNDAFGQELQRSGLDLSQFNANQMTQQQQYANLMGTGQGMLSGSMMEPEIRNQLIAQQQQQQALDQNYELGLYGNETARITGQAQADRANYQPDPWLSGLTSLGTSFLGSAGGGGWLSGVLGRKT